VLLFGAKLSRDGAVIVRDGALLSVWLCVFNAALKPEKKFVNETGRGVCVVDPDGGLCAVVFGAGATAFEI